MNSAAGCTLTTREARGEGVAVGAGLVPSKTSLQSDSFSVSLAPSACAERRVKRLKRAVWASGHLHGLAEKGHRPGVCWFVTLTYRPGEQWAPDHVSKAIQRFRDWCRFMRIACRYTWVGEMQELRLERGAPVAECVHYHLLAWLPRGVRMPHWDRRNGRRAAFWCHGMSNTQPALSGVGYLMKYLSKLGELTRFPKGLRLYGIGGLNEQGKGVRQWFNLPQWAKNCFGVGDLKRAGGRLVVRATGEILEPAYAVRLLPGYLELRALRALPERWQAGAYSSFPRVMPC